MQDKHVITPCKTEPTNLRPVVPDQIDYLMSKLRDHGDYEVVFSRQYPYKSEEQAYAVEIYEAGTVGIRGSLSMGMAFGSYTDALTKACLNLGVLSYVEN